MSEREMSQPQIPGITFSLLAPDCPSRHSDSCFLTLHNVPLRLTYGGQSLTLYHGETGSLGNYSIHCRIAQRATYGTCVDAGVIGASFTIQRM